MEDKTKECRGECPHCGSEEIDYGSMELGDGDYVFYPAVCSECHKEFNEYYNLEYDNTMYEVDNEEDLEEEE